MIKDIVFIISDNADICNNVLSLIGSDFTFQSFPSEAISNVLQGPLPNAMILDGDLVIAEESSILKQIRTSAPEIPVIVILNAENINNNMTAVKQEAFDYIAKPLDYGALYFKLENVIEKSKLKRKVIELQKTRIREQNPLFISESSTIREAMEFIGKIAKSPDTPVMIAGETGTGKEMIAQIIHNLSPLSLGPFVPINCAAIPRELIESELFGYEKGAFSGSNPAGKAGLIEAASGGTLFLDEVGDLGLEAQAKLLRFLESGEFYRVGGTRIYSVKTRIVSATNRNIDEMIARDQFRKDLYFRLGVIKVEVPTLNERPDCIMPLAKHFMEEFGNKFQKEFAGFTPEAENILRAHVWLGNVRELKNLIERAVLVGEGPYVEVNDFGLVPLAVKNAGLSTELLPELTGQGITLKNVLCDIEKVYIEKALQLTGGVERKAARLLNLNHQTFRYHRHKLL